MDTEQRAIRGLEEVVPEDVRHLCQSLNEAGFRSWIVGGCVRDLLLAAERGEDLGAIRNDWDIATTALPEQVQKRFRRVIPTGIQHGTVTVLMGHEPYEVTTLRGETTYSDGRRPDEVYFVDDITADLARRDFTVNAIAYDPLGRHLIDPFGGRADIRAGVIRCVGDAAERFGEDGLRVLRAARFVATLGFNLDPDTARAIEPSLATYRKVSPERVRDEWMKAMKAKRPSLAFEVMREHGLLAATVPEFMESVGCEQNQWHAYDVWTHTLHTLDDCPTDPVLRMSALFHDVGKPRSREWSTETNDYTFWNHERIGADMAKPILERLRFSNEERDHIVGLVRHHLLCYEDSWSDAAVRRWLRRVSPELAPDLYRLARADVRAKGREVDDQVDKIDRLRERAERIVEQGAALSTRDLALNGRDLMTELEMPPGPQLGEILRELLERVTEEPSLNEREELLAIAKTLVK